MDGGRGSRSPSCLVVSWARDGDAESVQVGMMRFGDVVQRSGEDEFSAPSGLEVVDPVEWVRFSGRRPSECRDASEAGRPAAYELMIFLSACVYVNSLSRRVEARTHLVIQVVLSPSWNLLRLDSLSKLTSSALALSVRV